MQRLLHSEAYLLFCFEDGSTKQLRTTLNPEILQRFGVKPEPPRLFDMDKGIFIMPRKDAIEIKISNKQFEEGGVNAYVSQFI